LEISGNRLGDKGGKILVEVLSINRTLSDLDISGNLLTNETGYLLASALETHNRKLDKLNLMNNLFTEKLFLTTVAKYVKDLNSNVGKTVICDGIQEF
jgi:Ran GTPase-activating protein (RanGAP) involved in mRNA processing and transport